MQITINGQQETIDDGLTVAALLDARGLANKPCAVEVNRSLVPKAEHAGRELREGDSLEIVTLVGGG
jgi:sulfur carrier protein